MAKILIIDDDEMMCTTLATLVERKKHVATSAVTLKDGIDLASREDFDLVFLDLTVPGSMGGVDAIQKMRAMDATIKAIVTSGYSNDDVLANYSDHGFNDYIIKPFKISELSQVLRRVFNSGEKNS